MNVKALIEENNRKRELLTPENEAYYSDLLIYIRLKFRLSEQHTEEVLMELLDHLLEGQRIGKTGKDIFGDDLKGYADEIIEQLPKSKKRELFPFIGGIIANIIGWVLIIRGFLFLILSPFTEVNSTVYPVTVIVVAFVIAAFVTVTIMYIIKSIEGTLFKEKQSKWKEMIKVGLTGAIGMASILLIVKFLPKIGPSFEFSWWASLLTGFVILASIYVYKQMKKY
ncbi:DUF1129 family protein [Robertmurraya sp. DFI.2.37]|uniref:DUF1129 family protein n=1 Tax=Robertmurraya sp. DFI.2.37 TaxID=3031819 RepID=UPI0012482183|nr:DUF1129 family protein [Robertmurraya sp. DFI.2.37]MDF1508461.1 DUF1129 family protein [Robertmurraya sp. DFI.2.37]